jgi:hypothetical protein
LVTRVAGEGVTKRKGVVKVSQPLNNIINIMVPKAGLSPIAGIITNTQHSSQAKMYIEAFKGILWILKCLGISKILRMPRQECSKSVFAKNIPERL